MRLLICLCLIVSFSGSAHAGAWPRDKGAFFLSVSQRLSTEIAGLTSSPGNQPDSYANFYGEYGVTRRLTFGFDAGYTGDWQYSAMGFLRYTLTPPDARHQFAVIGGYGTSGLPATEQYQIGGAWGYGFALGERWTGWTGLDASAIIQGNSGETILKADLTLGLKRSEHWMMVFQLQSGKYPGSDAYLRAAPSVVIRTGSSSHIQLGVDLDLLGSGRAGASVATWIEF